LVRLSRLAGIVANPTAAVHPRGTPPDSEKSPIVQLVAPFLLSSLMAVDAA
jgi:hypothetical protein